MVKIGADTDGLSKGLSSITTGAGKVVTGLAKIGAAGALALGGALVAATASGIAGIIAMEDQTAQLEAALKSTKNAVGMTSTEISGMATALQKTTKFAEEDTLAGQNLLLTFTNIGKDVFPMATTAMLDMATKMGGDASSNAIQLGKALNNPTEGISALTRVGVVFTDAQKDLIKSLQESGDMAGAQTVILKELQTEFGGSAIAAGQTFSGQLAIAKNALGEVAEGLASTLMPGLTTMLNWVNSNMPVIQTVAQTAFDIVSSAIKTVATYITDTVIPAFQKLWDWISPNIPAIKEIISVAFDTIKTIFKGISDFVTTYVIPAFQFLKEKFDEYFPAIKNAVMQAYDYLKPHFDSLVAIIKENLMPIITGLWDTFKRAFPGIQAIFEIVFPIIVGIIGVVMDIIGEFIKAVKGIYDFIKPGLDLLTDIFNITFGGIKKIIEGVQWVLDKFNGTPAIDKYSTVTIDTIYTGGGGSGGGFGSSRGYASGTSFATPGLHWVGENGPELLRFRGGESVLNARSSAKVGGGGGTANIFIELDGYTIARAIGQPLADIIRVKTGLKI